jgi:hypothetical protein
MKLEFKGTLSMLAVVAVCLALLYAFSMLGGSEQPAAPIVQIKQTTLPVQAVNSMCNTQPIMPEGFAQCTQAISSIASAYGADVASIGILGEQPDGKRIVLTNQQELDAAFISSKRVLWYGTVITRIGEEPDAKLGSKMVVLDARTLQLMPS